MISTANCIWQKNFGVLKSVFFMMKNAEWEFASSPIIYNGVLIIQCDVLENSFGAAFDVGRVRNYGKLRGMSIRVGALRISILTEVKYMLRLMVINIEADMNLKQEKRFGKCQEAVISRYLHQ